MRTCALSFLYNELIDAGVTHDRMAVVIVDAITESAASAARQRLKEQCEIDAIEPVLRSMQSYEDAVKVGKALTEVSTASLASEARDVVTAIIKRIPKSAPAKARSTTHPDLSQAGGDPWQFESRCADQGARGRPSTNRELLSGKVPALVKEVYDEARNSKSSQHEGRVSILRLSRKSLAISRRRTSAS